MEPSMHSQQIFAVIKALLREKRLKYRDLAGYLGLSLPAVKKFMSEANTDLDRLIEIAKFLDISLVELTTLSQNHDQNNLRFTEDQEIFFAENMEYYCYFAALNSGKTPIQVAEKHQLTPKSTRRYLKELEKLSLIQRLPGDRIKLLQKGHSTLWDDYGPMGKAYTEHYTRTITQRVLANLKTRTTLNLATGSRQLTDEQYSSFNSDFQNLLDKYAIISIANKHSKTNSDTVQFLFVADQWRDTFFDTIPNIDN